MRYLLVLSLLFSSFSHSNERREFVKKCFLGFVSAVTIPEHLLDSPKMAPPRELEPYYLDVLQQSYEGYKNLRVSADSYVDDWLNYIGIKYSLISSDVRTEAVFNSLLNKDLQVNQVLNIAINFPLYDPADYHQTLILLKWLKENPQFFNSKIRSLLIIKTDFQREEGFHQTSHKLQNKNNKHSIVLDLAEGPQEWASAFKGRPSGRDYKLDEIFGAVRLRKSLSSDFSKLTLPSPY